jgi:sortase A
VLLGYSGFVLVDAWAFQRREGMDLDRLLSDRRAASEGTPVSATNGLIGRMVIPRLGLSAVVVEGIGRTTLRRGVGHIPGTALPGEPGNVGLSGHRDTFFRPLKDLRIKDEIQFSTLKGDFKYEVESLRVVEPRSVGVLASSKENVLTLVTCYPFFYIGAAPRRFVVRARQVSPQALARASVK